MIAQHRSLGFPAELPTDMKQDEGKSSKYLFEIQ